MGVCVYRGFWLLKLQYVGGWGSGRPNFTRCMVIGCVAVKVAGSFIKKVCNDSYIYDASAMAPVYEDKCWRKGVGAAACFFHPEASVVPSWNHPVTGVVYTME